MTKILKDTKKDLKDEFQNSRHENFQDTKNIMRLQKAAKSTSHTLPMITKYKSQNFGQKMLVKKF